MPYSPLGRGFLAGGIDEHTTFDSNDNRGAIPRFAPEVRIANLAIVELLHRLGQARRATAAQASLAWLLAQRPWISPIPGTTKLHRLDENIGAADLDLSADDLAEIDREVAAVAIEGGRYPEAVERMTGI